MTPAQVAHIMPPLPFAVFDEFGKSCEDRVADHYRATVEAALRDAPQAEPRCAGCDIANGCPEFCRCSPPQAEGWVLVPVDVLKAASESLGSFVSDHGWGDADMQAMDNLDAYLAARPSAPTAVEPDERAMFEAWYFDKQMRPPAKDPDGTYSSFHARYAWGAWQARASKGTP